MPPVCINAIIPVVHTESGAVLRIVAQDNVDAGAKLLASLTSDETDDEYHAREDALYANVLHTIVSGRLSLDEVRQMAGTALLSKQGTFPRWTA